MMCNRSYLLASTMIAGFALGAGHALAQETPIANPAAATAPAPQAAPAEPAPQAAPDNTEVEAVVVTGSRIKKNEFTSPDPIQVITSEQSQLRGTANTAQMLQGSTIASGSPQVNSTISTAFVTAGGPGAQTVSLRGLGANRTVVLLNGRRAGPAGTRGEVSSFDLNVLPESIIDHIDILKDGASSIYGSDAVAGVVNIITKKDFVGGSIEGFANQPQRSGGEEYKANFSFGKSFDRGNVMVAFDYYRQREQTAGQRDYTNCAQQYTFNAATGARNDRVDPRTGRNACVGTLYDQIWVYTGSFAGKIGKIQYDYGHNLAPYVPTSLPGYPNLPPGFFIVGDTNGGQFPQATNVLDTNSPFELSATLTPETITKTVYAQGNYKLTDHIEAYGEILLNRRETKSHGFRQFWTYLYTYDYGDPFSAGFENPIGDPNTPYILSPTPVTNHNNSSQTVKYERGVAGLRGDFGSFATGWDWDIYTQYSRSEGAYSQDVILADAVYSSDGRSDNFSGGIANANSIPRPTASCVGKFTPISNRPCVDVAWLSPAFLAGQYTAAEEGFLFDNETGHTTYTQVSVEGSVSGNLFTLPAGPVGVALGAVWRKDKINDTPGPVTLAGNSWGLSGAGITTGEDTTKEAFGELSIPVLRNFPLAKSVSLAVSGRYTDVDSYGSNSTYKVGLNWQVTDWLKFRASKGTSFRAPALYELYLAHQTSFLSQRSVDPCINYTNNLASGLISQQVADRCAAQGIPGNYTGQGASITTISGGGAGNLKAETSEASTIGVIFSPRFDGFGRFDISLDYFQIDIADEVRQLSAASIVGGCYNSVNFPTDPLCAQFDRNAGSHLITNVRANFINIADQRNDGIDLAVRYRQSFPLGDLTLDAQATWQLKDTIALFADSTIDSNGRVGDPQWTGIFNAQFDHGEWTAFWSVNMIGRSSDAKDIPDTNTAGTTRYKISTEFTAYHSFSLRRKFGTWTFLAGVSNVFDEHPPAATTANVGQGYSTVGTSVLSSQYDYVGRRAFVDLTKKF